jgi:CDP-2,3-bis-(O-geranylgeranyl)-sn-glycerol synthase
MMPSYFANMAPVIFRNIKFLDYPLDFGKKINNKPILGKNKTWRGLFFGILMSILIAYVQNFLVNHGFFKAISPINYQSWLFLGFLMGFGAIFGDAFKSFLKRLMNIPPGKSWFIFDQIDYVIGSLAFVSLAYKVPIIIIVTSLIISPILTIIINCISSYLKIRDEW